MSTRGRSSRDARDDKSKNTSVKSSSRVRRNTNSPAKIRSGATTTTATSSSSKSESNRKGHRSSPAVRRSKPMPVNELDLLALSQQEQNSKLGIKNKEIPMQDRFERVHYNQRPNLMDRRGFWASRNKIDYRRTPMYATRRGIGGSDVTDQRAHYGRNGRQSSYQRSAEQKRLTTDEDKPVMNLFDPCKVPTGRSYFTHDDRATKPVHLSRPKYSGSGDSGWYALPVGWRNARKVRKNNDDFQDDYGTPATKRLERSRTDDVWKHDLFEDEES